MGTINMGKVLLGGLLAGLVMNISEFILNGVVLGSDWEATMKALNRPPMAGSDVAWFLLFGFLLGIVAVWVYAAIRPQFGAGPRTAMCAGLIVYVLAYFYPSLFMLVMRLFPARVIWISLVWGLIEAPVATVVGAWVYQE